MKKTIMLIFLLALTLLFAACANSSPAQSDVPSGNISDDAVSYWVSLSYASFDEDSTDFFIDANFVGYALNIMADGTAKFSGYRENAFTSADFLWQSSGNNTYLLGLKQSDGSMDEDATTFSLVTEDGNEDKILTLDMFGEALMFANVGENRYNGVVDFLEKNGS